MAMQAGSCVSPSPAEPWAVLLRCAVLAEIEPRVPASVCNQTVGLLRRKLVQMAADLQETVSDLLEGWGPRVAGAFPVPRHKGEESQEVFCGPSAELQFAPLRSVWAG